MNRQDFLQGMRLKTLSAGAAPVICAGAYAFYVESFSIYYFLLCLFLALFIQIATNFYNDAIDFKKGADINRVGEHRITTQGGNDYKLVMNIGHLFICLSLIVGIPLFFKGGTVFIILGVFSLALAYGYTGGPFPLAYLGLGEIFVFLFFGLVATVGSFYLITDEMINGSIFVIASQLGLLSSVLIAVNNYRDREEDVKVNKNTLATKLSRKNYLLLINVLLFFPYILVLYFVFLVDQRFIFNLFSIGIAHRIKSNLEEIVEMKDCNLILAMSGKHLVFFSLLFCGICIWI